MSAQMNSYSSTCISTASWTHLSLMNFSMSTQPSSRPQPSVPPASQSLSTRKHPPQLHHRPRTIAPQSPTDPWHQTPTTILPPTLLSRRRGPPVTSSSPQNPCRSSSITTMKTLQSPSIVTEQGHGHICPGWRMPILTARIPSSHLPYGSTLSPTPFFWWVRPWSSPPSPPCPSSLVW